MRLGDLTTWLLGTSTTQTARPDLTQYVLTDMGTSNGGNDFPGVAQPFGMVKLGPDLYAGKDSYAGYQPDGSFIGFSMMHMSGTGGAPKYGVISQMPVIGNVSNPLLYMNDTRVGEDETRVGYYKATLGSGIVVELGATSRAGIYQYTFPSGEDEANIVVDVSHVLPSYRGKGLEQHYLGGNISTYPDGHYEGSGTYDNGWNLAPPWTIYFCGFFDSRPTRVMTFSGTNSVNETDAILLDYSAGGGVSAPSARVGAVFSFDESTVVSRVGVSFISSVKACGNVQRQIPPKMPLANITAITKEVWNSDVLSKIQTTETNVTKLQLLYSSMYFMHLMPSNRTGENPKWISKEPYYDDIMLWDTFRCTTSLLHILQPVAYEEFIRSLIDTYRHDGYMPDSRSSNFNGASQGGSNADNVLADAYIKGVRGLVNWEDGYAAMVKDAEIVPPNNEDLRDPNGSTKEGRGALSDWLKYGYITPLFTRSVSRAVEYSANDFAVWQVASGLKKADAGKYLNRSRNWRNHWNPNVTAFEFVGFLSPRNITGFLEQDPIQCDSCYWRDEYYEALPYEYSMNAHHDMNTLIALAGGPKLFTDRLETMFTGGLNPFGDEAFNNTIYNPANEPSFTTPYLYNFAGRQDLSVKQSRYIADSYYAPTADGLSGNSDGGAMQSWLLWNMLGLYPLTGQTTFLIGSPWFSNTTISLGSGKKLSITTVNSTDGIYVQSLTVNGKPWEKSWITWNNIFARGGSMHFVLGAEPKDWARGPLPPSPASEFSTTTHSKHILPADAVPMAPETGKKKKKKKKKKASKVPKVDPSWAFWVRVRGVAAWMVMMGGMWAVWYLLKRRMRSRAQHAVEEEHLLEEEKKVKRV